jgi:hypothetical protein
MRSVSFKERTSLYDGAHFVGEVSQYLVGIVCVAEKSAINPKRYSLRSTVENEGTP